MLGSPDERLELVKLWHVPGQDILFIIRDCSTKHIKNLNNETHVREKQLKFLLSSPELPLLQKLERRTTRLRFVTGFYFTS